VGGGT